MTKKRRQYSAEFKFRVALEAVKENKTIPELASLHGMSLIPYFCTKTCKQRGFLFKMGALMQTEADSIRDLAQN